MMIFKINPIKIINIEIELKCISHCLNKNRSWISHLIKRRQKSNLLKANATDKGLVSDWCIHQLMKSVLTTNVNQS
ncbi:hypothetical protein SAMN05428947_114173 [Mucilaginibacter sp. OK283]|jgi:hypothetical protein|nr:hypothetical protein SAMN05428947_114173 [Mucilaginibacter sp. OK283]